MFQLTSRPGWFLFSPQLYYVTQTFLCVLHVSLKEIKILNATLTTLLLTFNFFCRIQYKLKLIYL